MFFLNNVGKELTGDNMWYPRFLSKTSLLFNIMIEPSPRSDSSTSQFFRQYFVTSKRSVRRRSPAKTVEEKISA